MGLRKIQNKTDYVFCGCNARFYFLIFTNVETMTCKYAHLWKHRNSRNTCKEYKFLYIVVINSDLSYLYIIRPQTFLVNQAKSVVLTFYWPKMIVDQKMDIINLCKKYPVQQTYYYLKHYLYPWNEIVWTKVQTNKINMYFPSRLPRYGLAEESYLWKEGQ